MRNFLKSILLIAFIFFGLFVLPTGTKTIAEESTTITQVKASHILVETEEEADSLKTRIDNGENFGLLAKKYSKCPSGENGGDLGYFKRGQMVKEFEIAAFNLPTNKVSEPVKTDFGWHLIKVYDKI